tara:strand:+ start:355 stop:1005 length:651 start_codon:yes stop_codon:yes gene_type:complete
MINSIFKQFENKHKGQVAVLFGSGPSLNEYKHIEADVYVGVNYIGDFELFDQSKDNHQKLDYYFFGDRGRCMDESFDVRIAKFGASEVDGSPHELHYSKEEVELFGAYPMSVRNMMPPRFTLDISENATCGVSVIFHALNFLLYTGIKTIYIVGCDCNEKVCFDGKPIINSGDASYDIYKVGWKEAKNFIDNNNLETEIISVNPVGLKNLFKEIKQ